MFEDMSAFLQGGEDKLAVAVDTTQRTPEA
jgi:hypothetical protein